MLRCQIVAGFQTKIKMHLRETITQVYEPVSYYFCALSCTFQTDVTWIEDFANTTLRHILTRKARSSTSFILVWKELTVRKVVIRCNK